MFMLHLINADQSQIQIDKMIKTIWNMSLIHKQYNRKKEEKFDEICVESVTDANILPCGISHLMSNDSA